MKGDFSRNTFDPHKHFTRVLMQQGRVQLDADWNEQAAILLHYLRSLAADLIGPHGGPSDDDCGFKIEPNRDKDFEIGFGRYYVEGILCESDEPLAYTAQPQWPISEAEKLEEGQDYLVYLDVWERHITHIEDPNIREVALGGPDTATRAQVVWQVKVLPVEGGEDENEEQIAALQQELEELYARLETATDPAPIKAKIEDIQRQLEQLQERRAPSAARCEKLLHEKLDELGQLTESSLRAQAYVESPSEDACITPPEARYRGAENQLYRVEIHTSGKAWDGEENTKPTAATFKWSRDNGSVVAAWLGQEGENLIVSGVRDRRRSFAAGQWVELTHDERELRGEPGAMVQVVKAEADRVTIDPETASDDVSWSDKLKNPKVRRWDHEATRTTELSSGAVPVRESTIEKPKWLDLEDGIRIMFEAEGEDHLYRTGDYWLIPARTATGDVEWPKERDEDGELKRDAEKNPIPKALPPHGVEHHYAPLAIISVGDGGVKEETDCRRRFEPLAR